MASNAPAQHWSQKLRGSHVRLRWYDCRNVLASLHGELMDVAGGNPIRARARGNTAEGAMARLWLMIEHVPLVPEPVASEVNWSKKT